MKKFIVETTAGIPAVNILRQYRVNPSDCIIIDDPVKDEHKLRGYRNVDDFIYLPLSEYDFYLKASEFLKENHDLPLSKLKESWLKFLENNR